jgi:hypothetical protein
MVSTCLARNDVIDVHLTLICATQLTDSTITREDTLSLLSVSSAVEFIYSHLDLIITVNT